MKKVAERYGVSISTPWRWANEKRFEYLNFPKPVPYGPNTSGISEAELDAYDAERVAKRDDVAARVTAKAHERDDIDADGNDVDGDGDGDDDDDEEEEAA